MFSVATALTDKGLTGLWKSHLFFALVGFFITGIILLLHFRLFERLAYFLYAVGLGLLAAVLVFGSSALGAKRWLNLGGFSFQPSEMMKLLLVFALAKYYHNDRGAGNYPLRELIIPTILTIVPVGLIMMQPDLGTAIILLAAFASMTLFAGINTKSIFILIITGLLLLPVVYNYGLKDYQKQRIHTFIDPMSDPKGAGYNSLQSMIAIGSGKIIGKGYRKGTQSKLSFLPEQQTDFSFSVYNEEHGLIGSLVLLSLYSFIFLRGLKIAYSSNDKFGTLMAIGILSIMFWHVFINMMMTMGLLPIVGIPLPFMSYGGTALMVFMTSIAIITNISNKKPMF